MGVIIYIAILALFIYLDYYIAKQFQYAAMQKGYTEAKYFNLCFLLGPVGYLLVIALPVRSSIPTPVNEPVKKVTTANKDMPTIKSGKCQLCGGSSFHLTECRINDEFGTRYRDICDACVEKLNANDQ